MIWRVRRKRERENGSSAESGDGGIGSGGNLPRNGLTDNRQRIDTDDSKRAENDHDVGERHTAGERDVGDGDIERHRNRQETRDERKQRMPPRVTGARRACAGNSSTSNAPRKAASSMRGKATRNTYQKLLA